MTGTRPRAPVVLFWGEDDFLLREAALTSLGQVRPTEVDAGEWRGGELQDLATPSLFGEARALLVTDCRSLPKEAVAELAAYLAAPDPSAPLLLACTVAERGKPPAALVKLIEPVGEIRQVQVTKKDLEPFLVARAKGDGLELTPPGARALVEALGNDVGELASALDQLASAFGGQRVGPKEIAQQFRGLGEQQTWDLCDKAFAKDLPGAMRSLRSLEESGDDALKVLGGIAITAPRPDQGAVAAGPAPARRGREAGGPAVRLAGAALRAAGLELHARGPRRESTSGSPRSTGR